MRKFAMSTIAVATLLVGGLAGCGNDGANDTGTFRTEQYQATSQRGTTGARYTGEGPITDMFTDDDRVGQRVQRYERRNAVDGSRLGVQSRQNKYNQGRYTEGRYTGQNVQRINQRTRYSTQGTLGENNRITDGNQQLRGSNTAHPRLTDNTIPRQTNGNNINNEQIERTVESMANVNDCHVVSQGDSVIIGVDTNGNNREQLENEIRNRVQQIVQGKNVYVVTDEEQVNRVRTLGERIRNGGDNAMEEVGATINAMINDLARAAKRPFENNR